MATNRWKSLDYAAPSNGKSAGQAGRPPDRATSEAETVTDERGAPEGALGPISTDPWSGRLPGVVGQARGAYLLRNYQAVVDLLEPQLTAEPELPDGQRLLGQALARLHREPEAVERLREAGRQSLQDWLARASLASLLLSGASGVDLPIGEASANPRNGPDADRKVGATNNPNPPVCSLQSNLTEAVTSLQTALDIAPLPAVRELLGAACWRYGQAALAGGRFPEAASRFGRLDDDDRPRVGVDGEK